MSYSLLNRVATKAKKTHRCVWCYLPILQGSQYVRETSTYDGHFQNFAWHEACRKGADDYFDEGGCEEFTSGNEMPFYALFQLEAQNVSSDATTS